MKTPFFWYYEERFTDWLYPQLLTPFSWIYETLSREFSKRKSVKVAKPVICVGNATAGGTGKTPFVIYLAQTLTEMGLKPHVISRGYGGRVKKSKKVDLENDLPDLVGDEPLLIAQHAPCWVGKSKKTMAAMAIKDGADVIIMDDGFQNQELVKDYSFMIIDGPVAFGNEKIIPAGPLREPLDNALKRASAYIIMNYDRKGIRNRLDKSKPIIQSYFVPTENKLRGKRVYAFAGLGRPEKFLGTLLDMEADILHFEAFPDHFYYSQIDIEKMVAQAAKENALLITTEKDLIRIPEHYRGEIGCVRLTLDFDDGDEDKLRDILQSLTGKK